MLDNLSVVEQQLVLFSLAFNLAGSSGVAWLLRSNRKITLRSFLGAFLNSGYGGLITVLLWYKSFSNDVPFLMGLCCLAGIGGLTTVELMTRTFHRVMVKYVEVRLGSESDKEEEQ